MPLFGDLFANPSAQPGRWRVRTRGRGLLGLAILVFIGCSPSAPTAATDVAFARACDEANDGERVAVQGYLRLPDSFSGERSVVLRLYETEAFAGSPVGVQVQFGSEPNQVDMVPTSYSDEDLSVHLSGGGTAGHGTPVRVSGKVYQPLVDQDFACALENVLVEAAG
jgi:hypothetical protein